MRTPLRPDFFKVLKILPMIRSRTACVPDSIGFLLPRRLTCENESPSAPLPIPVSEGLSERTAEAGGIVLTLYAIP